MIFKRTVFILSLLAPFYLLHAQETKKVTNRISQSTVEVYYITKKDKIREGPYQVIPRSGLPSITGYYANGKKDSSWFSYSYDHKYFVSKQFYTKGIKTGVWEFYSQDTLQWTYNFDSSRLRYFVLPDAEKDAENFPAYQDEKGNWVYHTPDQHAMMISIDYFGKLMSNLTYPTEAQSANQQGQVKVAVLVDEEGMAVSYEVGVSSGSPSLDAEALRVIKIIQPEFIAAENKAVKLKSLVLMPVNFRLESN